MICVFFGDYFPQKELEADFQIGIDRLLYLKLFPSFCFSFSFALYIVPVYDRMNKRGSSENNIGFISTFTTLGTSFVFSFMILSCVASN